jgi:hypothetical protein
LLEPAIQFQLNSRFSGNIQKMNHLESPNFYASFLSRPKTYPSNMGKETSRYLNMLIKLKDSTLNHNSTIATNISRKQIFPDFSF